MKTSKLLKSQVCIALLGAGCLIGSTAYAENSATVVIAATVATEVYVMLDPGNAAPDATAFLPSALIPSTQTDPNTGMTAEIAHPIADLDLCLASNAPNKAIKVKVATSEQEYFLVGSAANDNTLPYKVEFAESAGILPTELDHDTYLNVTANEALNCSGGSYNSRILVSSQYDGLTDLTADTYSGTLTITVEPQS